jgi:hypothetical protein
MAKNILFLLLSVLLTLVIFSTTEVTERNEGYDSDGVVYAMISSMPLFTLPEMIVPPFCYRILTPKLASLLPGELLDRFRVIAVLANILSIFTLYKILKLLHFSDLLCGVGILLYAGVFWTLKFSFYAPAYIDHVTGALLLLIVYCTLSDRFIPAIVLVCLSVLQKESLPMFSLFVAAQIWHRNPQPTRGRTKALAWAAVVIPFFCYVAFHEQFVSQRSAVGTVVLTEAMRFADPAFWPVFLHAIFSGLGLLPVILLADYRPWLKFLRERPALIVYLFVAAGALLVGVDKSRLFTYALPVVVVLGLVNLQHFLAVPTRRAVGWVALVLVGHWYIGNGLSPIGSFAEYIVKLVPEHAVDLGAGDHLPFLIRNCVLGGILLVLALGVRFGVRSVEEYSPSFTPSVEA